MDVADEGNVGLIKVINEKELEKTKSIRTGFGNIDGENFGFDHRLLSPTGTPHFKDAT